MSIYDIHNIHWFSPSAVNTYIQDPAKWILQISGFKSNIGIPAFWRGSAVDHALQCMFADNLTDDQCLNEAQDMFLQKHDESKHSGEFIDDKKAEDELDSVKRYLKPALAFYRQFPRPSEIQKKIKFDIDGIDAPMIGYLDLFYDGVFPEVRDIKTVSRAVNNVPDSVKRQMAVYCKAVNATDAYVDYIHANKTNSKVTTHTVDVADLDYHWLVVEKAVNQMVRLLSYSDDISEIAQLVMPNFDSWTWSHLEKEAARKLWRI